MQPRNSLGHLTAGGSALRFVASFAVLGFTWWVPFGWLGLETVETDRPLLVVFVLAGVFLWWYLLRSAIVGFVRMLRANLEDTATPDATPGATQRAAAKGPHEPD